MLLDKKIRPDVEGFLAVLKREGLPRRVHHIELFLDDEMKEAVCGRFGIAGDIRESEPFAAFRRDIKLHEFLGYDAFRVFVRGNVFPDDGLPLIAGDTTDITSQKRKERTWLEEHKGRIQSWQDFESYPWPKVSDVDLKPLEWLEKNMPGNMGCYELTAHIFEHVEILMGYETLCYKIFDEPDLVDAMFQKVGGFYADFTRMLCGFKCICLIWGSDDLGFRTSTMLSAQFLREKVLPWHKRCADIAHQHGRPYLLHSCGKLDEIMPDLIGDVRIDAKHSYEDAILPVIEAKRRYGKQIAILGGIDMDFLCRADEQVIRKRVRQTLESCMPGGGYCLGTGNTVANYMPVDNYLVMLDEGRRF